MEAKLIDSMGDDNRVVDAARVSFSKPAKDYTDENNQKLIRYLAGHNHWTPFSHVQITMHEKVPLFVARQRFKHMVGFTYNEVSRRYVSDTPEFYIPPVWRERAENKKQGSGEGPATEQNKLMSMYNDLLYISKDLYEEMIEGGVAPEQARMVLPQSMYTEYFVSGSLPAWARAYKLRIDSHSQKEIQELAKMWDREISSIKGLEHSWKALKT